MYCSMYLKYGTKNNWGEKTSTIYFTDFKQQFFILYCGGGDTSILEVLCMNGC